MEERRQIRIRPESILEEYNYEYGTDHKIDDVDL